MSDKRAHEDFPALGVAPSNKHSAPAASLAQAHDDDAGEKELQEALGVTPWGSNEGGTSRSQASDFSAGPSESLKTGSFIRRTQVESKEFLHASNIEPGGQPNSKPFWIVQPAYGSSFPEPTDSQGQPAYILSPSGRRATLAKTLVCKQDKDYSGSTVWKLSFVSGGVSGQIVLAMPASLRANLIALDLAMIASRAAALGAVAVLIRLPGSNEGCLKVDEIGCVLSKPDANGAVIDTHVAAIEIPVGFIRSDVGGKLDTALKMGLGEIHMFTGSPQETRKYLQGNRVANIPGRSSPPLHPAPPPTGWLMGAWSTAVSKTQKLVAHVRGKVFLSAALEKALKSDPWGLAQAESLLDAPEDEVQRDLMKTLDLLVPGDLENFPISLLVVCKLGSSRGGSHSNAVHAAFEQILNAHVCSGRWADVSDNIISRLCEQKLLDRFEDILRGLLSYEPQLSGSPFVARVSVVGLLQVAELCRCCMQINGRASPDFRHLWGGLIVQLRKRDHLSNPDDRLRSVRELGSGLDSLPFGLPDTHFGVDEVRHVIMVYQDIASARLEFWWDTVTLGQRDVTGSRFGVVTDEIAGNRIVQSMLGSSIINDIASLARDPIPMTCRLLKTLDKELREEALS